VPFSGNDGIDSYASAWSARQVPGDFTYTSGRNPVFLSVEAIRDLIRRHVDPAFEPR